MGYGYIMSYKVFGSVLLGLHESVFTTVPPSLSTLSMQFKLQS